MRALAFAGRDDKLRYRTFRPSSPARGRSWSAVEAASVNGIDAATAAGYLWDMLPATFPVVLGRDLAAPSPRPARA